MGPTSMDAAIDRNPTNSFILLLREQANLRNAASLPRGPERKSFVWERLQETARASQPDVLAAIEELQAGGLVRRVETFTSPNAIVVEAPNARGRSELLGALQALDGVKAIHDAQRGTDVTELAPETFPLLPDDEPSWGLDVVPGSLRELPDSGTQGPALHDGPVDGLEQAWGVELMGAAQAWERGATGAGLVYGSVDTGVQWDHEALRHAYRGFDADSGEVSHDYSWFDANLRPSSEPQDRNGHGTHTIGSVLGRSATTAWGVAPEASFIAANALTSMGTEGIMRSLEWMQAPTRIDGSDPDPTKAPDVVGMSFWNGEPWGRLHEDSMRNLAAAGIEPVKSAGNRGPGPESVTSPGQFRDVHTVAAVDRDGEIARFSSRGPSPLRHDRSTPQWKPDLAAPGVDVPAPIPGNRYGSKSGTSMAQPHVAGAILSVLSKHPTLDGRDLRLALAAGSIDAGARGRDLEFGWGISNLPATLDAAEAIERGERPNPTSRDLADEFADRSRDEPPAGS